MTDFRGRLGRQLDAAAARMLRDRVQDDFRARLGVSLTAALIELNRTREAAPAPARVGDFRDRLGIQLTGATRTLVGERNALAGARRRGRPGRAVIAWLTGRSPARAGGDFRGRFGVQLSASASMLAGVPEPAIAVGQPAAPRRRRRGLAPRVARPLAVAAAVTAFAGAAAASSLWLVSVGNPNGGTSPGLSATAPPAAQLAALAVLRRAQTSADRGPAVQAALVNVNDFTTGVRSNYVRLLETTAGGPVVLVPVAERDPTTAGPAGTAAHGAIADALCVYYPVAGTTLGAAPSCWSTSQLLSGQALAVTDGHVFGLAPDGIDSVTVSVASGATPISAPVTENFFDVALPASAAPPAVGGAPVPASNPTVTFHRA